MEATYFADVIAPSSANIVVSKIHYHPADPTPAESSAGFADADEFEFIELMNIGTSGVNLTGCYFTDGIDGSLGDTVLPAGGRIVLARNAAAFEMRHGFAPGGLFTGKLSNTGDRIWFKKSVK